MADIITVEQLSEYSGQDMASDKRAEAVVKGVNAWVKAYTGRIWGGTELVKETHDFEPVIFLNFIDIREILVLKVGKRHWNVDDLRYSKDTGRVVLRGGNRGFDRRTSHYDNVYVEYTAGVDEVPFDLQEATLSLAMAHYSDRAEAGVTSESLGAYSVSYGNSMSVGVGAGQSGMTDPMAIFNYYRVRKI